MVALFITFMVNGFITVVVESYYIYGWYYIYGQFLLHLWLVLHLWYLLHLWVIQQCC